MLPRIAASYCNRGRWPRRVILLCPSAGVGAPRLQRLSSQSKILIQQEAMRP